MANSPDQMSYSDLGLHCLQRPIWSNIYGYYGMEIEDLTLTVISYGIYETSYQV